MAVTAPARADFFDGAQAYQRGDYVSAAKAWRPLARQGQPVAEFNMGVLYYRGLGVPLDRVRGRDLWLSAALHSESCDWRI